MQSTGKKMIIRVARFTTYTKWLVDVQTKTIEGLAWTVSSKIKKYKGLTLSFTFEINAQKCEVSTDDELRRLLRMVRLQDINTVIGFCNNTAESI